MDQLKKINSLQSFVGKLKGKKVFLRADFNVPIEKGVITDAYRIDAVISTLDFLQHEGAVTIIASHIETADSPSPTLKPVFEYIKKEYPKFNIVFCEDFLNSEVLTATVQSCVEGSFVLLENIRNAKETVSEKDNSVQLAEYLKEYCDFYIQEAFAVSHRSHASVDALPRLFAHECKAAGFLLSKEIEHLSLGLVPRKPLATILSGMKFSTKLPLIQKYLEMADMLFVGGALFNNIAKSMGYNVGQSLIDTEAADIDQLVKTDVFKQKVYIPKEVVVRNVDTGEIRKADLSEVQERESIQDISEDSMNHFVQKLEENGVQTIVWNGPIGNYEKPEFSKGTIEFAKLLYAYVRNNVSVQALIGGGDTVGALQNNIVDFDKQDRIFVSTGGGAMLEFLEKDGHLPGIDSLL